MDTKKIDDYMIEVTTQAPQPEPVSRTYERQFIEEQIKSIIAQRDALIALKEAELKECEDILKAMDVLGIIVKPIETIPSAEIP